MVLLNLKVYQELKHLTSIYRVETGNGRFRKKHLSVIFKHRKPLFVQKLRYHYTILYKKLSIYFLTNLTQMTVVFTNLHF